MKCWKIVESDFLDALQAVHSGVSMAMVPAGWKYIAVPIQHDVM